MYDNENVFAKIISKRLPAEVIYEDAGLLAFKDINPVAPVHVLVAPKKQYTDYTDFMLNATVDEVRHFFGKIVDLTKMLGLDESGYRLITNKGESVGQSVFHFHFHIIGGKKISALIIPNEKI